MITPLSQNDPLWANKYVGDSKLKFKTDGCLVTALTVFINHVLNVSYRPDQVNDLLLKVNGFRGAKLYWPAISSAFPNLKFTRRVDNYNNLVVSFCVYGKGLPVLVEVNPHAKLPTLRHWVLYIGKFKMVDPFDGQTKATSTYSATGYALIDRK